MQGKELPLCEEFAIFAPPPSVQNDLSPVIMGPFSNPVSNSISFHSPKYFQNESTGGIKHLSSEGRYTRKQAKEWLYAQEASPFLEVFELPPHAEADFLETGYSLQRKIAEGSLKKGVPYSFRYAERAPSFKERAGILLAALEQQEKTGGFLCGIWDREGGVIALTPEVLFRRQGQTVETEALAGTRLKPPHSMTLEEEKAMLTHWLSDPKEKAEHEWVVIGILESLKTHGEWRREPISIKASGALLHLETKISAKNVNSSTDRLLHDLHPTPALGAFPRVPGLEWLMSEDEKLPRSKYGAPFGIYFPEEKIEIYLVLIRGIEWSNHFPFCRMGAGAGVVAQSEMRHEWAEVQNKWRSIAKSLNLVLSKELP